MYDPYAVGAGADPITDRSTDMRMGDQGDDSEPDVDIRGPEGDGYEPEMEGETAQLERPPRPSAAELADAIHRRNRQDGGSDQALTDRYARVAKELAKQAAEAALAHKVGNQVERAYLRTTFYDRRRELMELWGDYCTGGNYLHDKGLDS